MEIIIAFSLAMLLVLGALFVIPRSNNRGKGKEICSGGNGATCRSYTKEEVLTHNTRNICWIIIKDKVYDVTSYVEENPGGDAILNNAGGDSTDGFFGPQHGTQVFDIIEDFCIGKMKDWLQTGEAADAPNVNPCVLQFPEDGDREWNCFLIVMMTTPRPSYQTKNWDNFHIDFYNDIDSYVSYESYAASLPRFNTTWSAMSYTASPTRFEKGELVISRRVESEKSDIDRFFVLDPRFTEREASPEHKQLWDRRYKEYLTDSKLLMDLQNKGLQDKEETNIKFEELYLRYKHMLYYAAELEQSPRNINDVFNEACAIYQIVYEKASAKNSAEKCSFVWKVAGRVLCHLYALESEGDKVLVPMSVVRKLLKKADR